MLALARAATPEREKHARRSVPPFAHERRREGSIPGDSFGSPSRGRIATCGTRSVDNATVSLECEKRSIDKFLTLVKIGSWLRRVEGALSNTLREGSFFSYNTFHLVADEKAPLQEWGELSSKKQRDTRRRSAHQVAFFTSTKRNTPLNFDSVDGAYPRWTSPVLHSLEPSKTQ